MLGCVQVPAAQAAQGLPCSPKGDNSPGMRPIAETPGDLWATSLTAAVSLLQIDYRGTTAESCTMLSMRINRSCQHLAARHLLYLLPIMQSGTSCVQIW